jgi:hypothetical protein
MRSTEYFGDFWWGKEPIQAVVAKCQSLLLHVVSICTVFAIFFLGAQYKYYLGANILWLQIKKPKQDPLFTLKVPVYLAK